MPPIVSSIGGTTLPGGDDDDALPPQDPHKLGRAIAQQLIHLIHKEGWQPGHPLGREEDIARRFGASRTIVREAIAVIEIDGLVSRKSGPKGGLFVAALPIAAAASSIRTYATLTGVGFGDIIRMRSLLDRQAIKLATARMQRDDIAPLRALLAEDGADDEGVFGRIQTTLRKIYAMAGNPALTLFSTAMTGCLRDWAVSFGLREPDLVELNRSLWPVRCRQIAAIIGCNYEDAVAEQRHYEAAWLGFEHQLRTSAAPPRDARHAREAEAPASLARFAGPPKKAQMLARDIADLIRQRGLAPGAPLGVEADLLRELGVGRAALREAIRILEYHHIVTMARGQGLRVSRPTPGAVIGLIAGALSSDERLRYADVAGLLVEFALATVEQLAADGPPQSPDGGALPAGTDAAPLTRLRSLLGAGPSPLLRCFSVALAEITTWSPRRAWNPNLAALADNWHRLGAALESRDAPLARRWMFGFMDALASLDPFIAGVDRG